MSYINQSPLEEVYNFVFKEALKLTSNVFSKRPDASVSEPFIFIAETINSTRDEYKLKLSGDVIQTVNIYAKEHDRHIVMEWLDELSRRVRKPYATHCKLLCNGINTQVLSETYGSEHLIRVVLDIDFKYYKTGV